MFAWLAGRPMEDATHNDGFEPEAPETPAPLFAARALRSAIFGTPKLVEADETTLTEQTRMASMPIGISGSSPSKPPGILMTPGLTRSARKSVTFGNTVVEKTGKHAVGKSGIPHDCPGKFPSPWTPKVTGVTSTRKTSLTKSLEDARDEASATKRRSFEERIEEPKRKAGPVAHIKATSGSTSITKAQGQEQKSASLVDDVDDANLTLDLNQPHSQSGKYWKSEYERYHEEARNEMKKLLKYKEVAKSFATRKDCEATDLRSKLLEEQAKLTLMEDRLKCLAAEIAENQANGAKDDCAKLMEELSRQKSLAIRYRNEVDQFRQLLEKQENLDLCSEAEVGKGASPKTAATLIEVSSELRRAREQVKEIHTLHKEMHALKMSLSMAEKRATRLSQENTVLARDLAGVRSCLIKSERRRQSAEERSSKQQQRSSEVVKSYENPKGLSEHQKQDVSGELQQRRRQIGTVEQEQVTHSKPLVPKHETATVDDAQLHSTIPLGQHSFESPKEPHNEKANTRRVRGDDMQLAQKNASVIPERDTESGIPLTIRKLSPEMRDSAEQNKTDVLLTIAGRSTESSTSGAVLSEIQDNGQIRRRASMIEEEPVAGFDHPIPDSRSTLPGARLPLSQLSLGDYEDDVKVIWKSRASPGPSVINFSPPKRMSGTSAPCTTGPSTDSHAAHVRHASMSSHRSRASLPPDRAAAAKARLAQRNAEKKRAKEEATPKENTRVGIA